MIRKTVLALGLVAGSLAFAGSADAHIFRRPPVYVGPVYQPVVYAAPVVYRAPVYTTTTVYTTRVYPVTSYYAAPVYRTVVPVAPAYSHHGHVHRPAYGGGYRY